MYPPIAVGRSSGGDAAVLISALVLVELPKGIFFFFSLSSLGKEDHLVVKGYAMNWFK